MGRGIRLSSHGSGESRSFAMNWRRVVAEADAGGIVHEPSAPPRGAVWRRFIRPGGRRISRTRSGRRTRRPETHRRAVEDRLADDRLDDRVVDPVVDGHPRDAAGHLLPRRAVRMAPAVRQADHPGTHLVGDRDTHLATMDAALEDRHLAVTDLMAGGVVGMNVEHAALATR